MKVREEITLPSRYYIVTCIISMRQTTNYNNVHIKCIVTLYAVTERPLNNPWMNCETPLLNIVSGTAHCQIRRASVFLS